MVHARTKTAGHLIVVEEQEPMGLTSLQRQLPLSLQFAVSLDLGCPAKMFGGVVVPPPDALHLICRVLTLTGIDMNIGIYYHVHKVQLVFPPNKKAASGGTLQVGGTRTFRPDAFDVS